MACSYEAVWLFSNVIYACVVVFRLAIRIVNWKRIQPDGIHASYLRSYFLGCMFQDLQTESRISCILTGQCNFLPLPSSIQV